MNKHKIILPEEEKAPIHTNNIFIWMWYFLGPYKKIILGFSAYRLIRYTWLSMLPLVTGYIIDGLASGKAQENVEHYIFILCGYMFFFFIALMNIVFIPESAASEKATRAMTLHSIRRLNALSLNWHEKEGSGGKLQRVMTGRKGFQELMRHIRWDLFPLVGDVAAISITVIIAKLPLIYIPLFFGFVSSYIFCSWFFARGYFQLYGKFNEKFENLLSGVYEFVGAIRTVKAFHLKNYIDHKASALEEIGQEAVMNAYSKNLMRWTICNGLGACWIFVFLALGFYWVLEEQITIGAYTSTVFLATFIWASCEVLGSILEKMYEHGNGISRLTETLRTPPKVMDLTPADSFPDQWKKISFNNVSYAYDGNETQGIKNISFHIQRGQKIAFVGNSGAGKSTLVKLIMKQMLPDDGQFTIDNTNISHIPTQDWLGNIGFVPQDVELFNLSIKENILIDRDNIAADIFEKVMKQAALNDFIEGLPEGLDTIIGERGIKLSGGQRQRLGIARALIRQAPIMIFDEATSSLDSISESKIQQAIENSFEDRTVFVIAHRLSTIRNVDRIIVLDQGTIIEEGRFDDLIKQGGHFEKLWSLQSKEK
jgi:ATP-binding cassette subfamily B protein